MEQFLVTGNWTIDSTENISSELNSFNQGPIYRGNLSIGYFNIQGETYNSEDLYLLLFLWQDSVDKM